MNPKKNERNRQNIECGHRDSNPGYKLGKRLKTEEIIDKNQFNEYLSLLEIQGLSKDWLYQIKNYLMDYLEFVGWKVDKAETLRYLKNINNRQKVSSYRKKTYQIRRLLHHFGCGWDKEIKLPPEPFYMPKRIMKTDILSTIDYFKGNRFYIQLKALTLLGATSGLRAEELYQLESNDIDFENRIVHVKHDPNNGKTTKTKQSRTSFFSEDSKKALLEYLQFFNGSKELKRLFSKTHIIRGFHYAPIHVKDLRKFFSQEWDRQGGPTSIKKIIMGHSLKGDVDLMHYNYQSEEDLKRNYDRVRIRIEV